MCPANLPQSAIAKTVADALAEDLGEGDLTAGLIPGHTQGAAAIVTRQRMRLAGRPWVDEVWRQLDTRVAIEWLCADGADLQEGDVLARLRGPARALLSGERTALNFLQLLSGTATHTAACVDAVAGTGATILDTRKTVPGLRLAQKYAVRCGGGSNHRMGLYDAVLVKENHIRASGGVEAALAAARAAAAQAPVEIEVESLEELRRALKAGATRLLLDNFDLATLRRAVAINRQEGRPPAALEASGGLSLADLRSVAETGVDFISVGALTKNVRAVDLSMQFEAD